MERIGVSSSNVRSVGYDVESAILQVEFCSGWLYDYYDVPAEVALELVNADSVGRYHASYIKGRYRFRRRR